MNYDCIIIGGGPAGLAAALEATRKKLRVLVVEREAKTGGILKQCIHDGFGVVRFQEKLSGPEYAWRFINEVRNTDAEIKTFAFVSKIEKLKDGYLVKVVDQEGVHDYTTKNVILATGCRERTRNQIFIPGTRPAGIYTAGSAQYLVNRLGISPGKKIVILGSGDIGLIMARRLTLEGAEVIGVYEIKNTPSGLSRNIMQCLHDFNIPLHLSRTVTNIFGRDRIEAVGISKVDERMNIIPGTEEIIECDTLILAVGLIPENELGENIGLNIDVKTKGPIVDQNMMTNLPGVFAVGNCLHVNDLVDYVSESAEIAAKALETKYPERKLVKIEISPEIMYLVPQLLNLNGDLNDLKFYFRSQDIYENCKLILNIDGKDLWSKKFTKLLPPEMQRLKLSLGNYSLNENSKIFFRIEVNS
ncbi:MAG TPA: FAD-dependent oxidoreductase [Acholeplasmataceae bacterium]|jgi:thioredoxin reductase|nr:FAD-dependent oxidoreductase [Acholeplasmataceae bacterium]